ncbi:MAG: hypothetical protein HY731_11160 [Candidatus Tectomicrobia bacterium]|nr:hypothetical protein [Candidatus Tectomicrobia bacterium]
MTRRTIRLLLLLIVMVLVPFKEAWAQLVTQTLRVQAHIDGRSRLILRANTAQWHHLDFAAPGRHGFVNLPTIINGVQWFPI